MSEQGPTTSPFSFVLIPADESKTPDLQRYEGNSDSELRETLRAYFAKVGGVMNSDQRTELQRAFKTKLESAKKKQEEEDANKQKKSPEEQQTTTTASASQQKVEELNDDGSSAVVPKKDGDDENEEKQKKINEAELLAHAVTSADDGSFEIVPIVLPTIQSKFRAISLYIDSTGMIKDLPRNDRASKLASREIRGDAFLLSNHDDPALDEWKRVDTTMDDFQQLYENPAMPMDMNNQSQAAAATAMREDLSKTVSKDDAQQARDALNKGRELFGKGKYQEASDEFTKVMIILSARTDLLEDDEDLQKSKTVAMLNFAGCALKLNNFQDAEKFSQAVLQRDTGNEKAAFRMATARMKLKDFDGARHIINTVTGAFTKQEEKEGKPAATVQLWKDLEDECKKAEFDHKKQQQKKFSKMFG